MSVIESLCYQQTSVVFAFPFVQLTQNTTIEIINILLSQVFCPLAMSQCFKVLRGFTELVAGKIFLIDNTSRARSNGVKRRCKQVQLDCTKFSLLTMW